jgi:dTMP kinase
MLIVFEGVDGVGKTSHSKRLAERMGARWACFPDRSTPIGKLIDGYLRGEWRVRGSEPVGLSDPKQNALVHQGLQLANRAEHLTLLKSAATSDLVLDRYWQSGYAYGKADGLDGDYMMAIHKDLPPASINILLDAPAEVSVERQKARGSPPEHYDRLEKLNTIRHNFLHLWADCGAADHAHWPIIDSRGGDAETAAAIDAAVVAARGA